MNGFRVSRVVVIVALTAAISVGCASSRSGSGCNSCGRDSSSGDSVPPRRTESAHTAHETTSGKLPENCPVTGKKLGSMGPPVLVSVNGQNIQVCCDACVATVQRNPEKYLTIDADELALAQDSSARRDAFYDQPRKDRGSRTSGGCQSCR